MCYNFVKIDNFNIYGNFGLVDYLFFIMVKMGNFCFRDRNYLEGREIVVVFL